MTLIARTHFLAETVFLPPESSTSQPRVEGLFRKYEEDLCRRTHQLFSWLLVLQWAFCIFIGGVWSPRSWAGSRILPHPHLIAALLLGGLLTMPAIAMMRRYPYHWFTRQVVATAQIGFSLLLIALSGGRIESHFHIFGSLAVLSLYRDWRVLPTVTLVVILHHLLCGYFFPQSVFGVPFTSVWRTAEHAGWVAFEDAVLIWACLVSRREMWEICRREDENDRLLGEHLELIANAPIGIFETTREGNLRLANPRLRAVLGIQAEQNLAETSPAAGRILAPADRDRFWQRLEAEGELRGFETAYTKPDGNVVSLVINAHLKANGPGAPSSAEGTVEDVTERKRAARELESVHQQLVVASRQAGMADVATGVLHNVGNVLTSVNLIIHDVQDRLRSSRISHLHGVTAILQMEKHRLPDYFATESGQALPDFMFKLDQHLESENNKIRGDVETLVGHFGHIREIIVMQQSSARLFGVTETLTAAELVQDAVTVNADSLRRHGVELRQIMADTTVRADRHKVLQILVNLIKNAKDSVAEARTEGREIILRVARHDETSVAISIEDNGLGIASEALSQVFQHGFTTKKDGHGFGLHSSALAAREMSGNLVAASAGRGRGAVFTLTLPVGDQPQP